MKYLAAAFLIAFSCFMSVFAAPSTSDNANPFTDLHKKVINHWDQIKCITDVVDKAIDGSDMAALWSQSMDRFDELINVDWVVCESFQHKIDIIKCKATVFSNGFDIVNRLVFELDSKSKWDLVKGIRNEIVTKCLGKMQFFEHLGDPEYVSFWKSLPALARHIMAVIEKVSNKYGYEDIWTEYQPRLQQQVDKLNECFAKDSEFAAVICSMNEAIAFYELIIEYNHLFLGTTNPQTVDIQPALGFLLEDLKDHRMYNSFGVISKIRCMSDAVTAAVKETDYAKKWEVQREDLKKLFYRIESCKHESSKFQEAKCVAHEIRNAYKIFTKFFASLKKDHYETFVRVQKYIKEWCF